MTTCQPGLPPAGATVTLEVQPFLPAPTVPLGLWESLGPHSKFHILDSCKQDCRPHPGCPRVPGMWPCQCSPLPLFSRDVFLGLHPPQNNDCQIQAQPGSPEGLVLGSLSDYICNVPCPCMAVHRSWVRKGCSASTVSRTLFSFPLALEC